MKDLLFVLATNSTNRSAAAYTKSTQDAKTWDAPRRDLWNCRGTKWLVCELRGLQMVRMVQMVEYHNTSPWRVSVNKERSSLEDAHVWR